MILCLDIGNTHIFGGIYEESKLKLQFRYSSFSPSTSDQIGIFLKSVLRENELDVKQIKQIMICSVVPSLNYSTRSAFLKYFSLDPVFLDVHSYEKLKINYPQPLEIGADRISNAIAATHLYPEQNIIVIDLGTATTVDALKKGPSLLSGPILPGLQISMKALAENTAKLSPVPILKPKTIIGESTTANIQSGLYYQHLGGIKEVVKRIADHYFADEKFITIGTGGFSSLFEKENIFDAIVPELVLQGLLITAQYHEGRL